MATFQTPRIVVEQSPWQTFFEELPGMFATYQKTKLHAEEAERARQFARDSQYIKHEMDKNLMYEKAIIGLQEIAINKGVTIDIDLGKNEVSSPATHTRGGDKMNKIVQENMIQAPVHNAEYRRSIALDNLNLITQGQNDALILDINYDGKIDTAEIGTFQNSPEGQQLLKSLDLTEFPEPYLRGARAYLEQPKVKQSRKALFDLTNMLGAHVKDTDPDAPGLQFDPSDPRAIEIENTLNAIQLQQIPAATAALQKVVGAEDPYARQKYTPLEQTLLEKEGMIVGEDPRMGAIVKRSREDIMASEEFLNLTKQRQAALDSLSTIQDIDPRGPDYVPTGPEDVSPEQLEQADIVGQTEEQLEAMLADTDVSRQEAAETIIRQKNIAQTRKDAKDDLKLMDAGEEREQENFDAAQDQRYRGLRSFYESGPLYARKTTSGKFPENTPKWVKKIYNESKVLYSLLSGKTFPGVGGKHESDDAMKIMQQDIQKYITEIMTKSGYDPHADLERVYNAGETVDLKARNVLKSPKFQQAVDPRGDGTYDTKKAAINLDKLFNLHGKSQLRWVPGIDPDKRTMAQGEAIAHLYNVWFGLEQELIRRKGYSLERQDKQRDYEKVIQGL